VTKIANDLVPMNIVMFGVVFLTFFMMIMWSRTTRGKWPSRKKAFLLSGICLSIWLFGNACYFYFYFQDHH